MVTCRQKKEICGDALIRSDGFTAITVGIPSTNGDNFYLIEKYRGSLCTGNNKGTETDLSTTNTETCKLKCKELGTTLCKQL